VSAPKTTKELIEAMTSGESIVFPNGRRWVIGEITPDEHYRFYGDGGLLDILWGDDDPDHPQLDGIHGFIHNHDGELVDELCGVTIRVERLAWVPKYQKEETPNGSSSHC